MRPRAVGRRARARNRGLLDRRARGRCRGASFTRRLAAGIAPSPASAVAREPTPISTRCRRRSDLAARRFNAEWGVTVLLVSIVSACLAPPIASSPSTAGGSSATLRRGSSPLGGGQRAASFITRSRGVRAGGRCAVCPHRSRRSFDAWCEPRVPRGERPAPPTRAQRTAPLTLGSRSGLPPRPAAVTTAPVVQ